MQANLVLPRYKCHKEVGAFKIGVIEQSPADKNVPGGSWELKASTDSFIVVTMCHEWYLKHRPIVGGYFVLYDDGYASYSTAEAFESGYTPLRNPTKELDLGCYTPSILTLRVSVLCLSRRILSVLRKHDIIVINELLRHTRNELMDLDGLGITSVKEIEQVLEAEGLKLFLGGDAIAA